MLLQSPIDNPVRGLPLIVGFNRFGGAPGKRNANRVERAAKRLLQPVFGNLGQAARKQRIDSLGTRAAKCEELIDVERDQQLGRLVGESQRGQSVEDSV